ncbi:MAG: IclR family transcriptional regulator [Microbacterium sp.]|nr:IclR family transcriptional regulator [Microbacterium sp.]
MRTHDSISRPNGGRQTVNVLQKALDVLEQIVWSGPMTLGELAEASGVERAAVYRIVNTFIERDYFAQDKDSRRFVPGSKLKALSSMVGSDVDPVEIAAPFLEELQAEFGETVNFGLLVGSEVHYLKVLESLHPLRMMTSMEDRDPAYATALGKAVLSSLDDDTVRSLFDDVEFRQRTPRTVRSLGELIEELEAARARGFAIDDEENEIGAICVAAAIDAGEDTRYAISVSGPIVRVDEAVVARLGERLRDASAQIGERLRTGAPAAHAPL